jgi:type IV pilus assembly protein PilC
MSPIVGAGAKIAPAVTTAAKPSAGKGVTLKKGKRVPGAKKIVSTLLPGFSRQLSAMLSAGMPIVSSLDALEEQTDHPSFKAVLVQLKANIENGAAFSEALRQFPSIFDDLYANMVKGGESGGQLAETVARLAGFLEASSKLKQKVKSAMMYPVIVMCIAMTIAVGMIVFIVPVFGEMFADFNAELPKPTQFLLDISNVIRANGLIVIIVSGILVFLFKKWKVTPKGAMALDQLALKAPVFGDLNKKVAASRFARTFGQLIRSGVPILSALDIVAGATGNLVTGGIILNCKDSVERGEPLSLPLMKQSIFPPMLVRMLQAGEKTGKIDEMMESIADFYDDEVNAMLDGLTSLLEPLLMVFLGVIIGGIVICMFLPIFKIGEVVQG